MQIALPSFSLASSSSEELLDILTQWGFFYLRGEEADNIVKLARDAFDESKFSSCSFPRGS